jgi:hypothetical protein
VIVDWVFVFGLIWESQAALESKNKELASAQEAHGVELLKKDKKLAQLKELAMAKATEKLKERDAMILRLKKEKLRLAQEREEEVEALVRQHRADSEELQRQLRAKGEALGVLRAMLADVERDENGAAAAADSKTTKQLSAPSSNKAETLLKLQNIKQF